MAKLSFDFSNIQKSKFNVTLKDGRQLIVCMPKKKTFEKVKILQTMQENDDADVDDAMFTFAGIIADALSNNINGETITAAEIADQYDLEEMKEFIVVYYNDFVSKLADNPN